MEEIVVPLPGDLSDDELPNWLKENIHTLKPAMDLDVDGIDALRHAV